MGAYDCVFHAEWLDNTLHDIYLAYIRERWPSLFENPYGIIFQEYQLFLARG
jgi:hypothetical protein